MQCSALTIASSSLTAVIHSYPYLEDRYTAVESLTLHETPHSALSSQLRHWALQMILDPQQDLWRLLRTGKGGEALVDIALFYAGPGFLDALLHRAFHEWGKEKHPVDNMSSGSRRTLCRLWIIGFLPRMLDTMSSSDFGGRNPRDVYSDLLQAFLSRARPWDKLHPLEGHLSSAPVIRVFQDLQRLGLDDLLLSFTQSIISHVVSIASREYFSTTSQFTFLWVPFLHDLWPAIRHTFTGVARQCCCSLFSNILTSYAWCHVRKQPPLEPDDLKRVPFHWFRSPDGSRANWPDGASEVYDFLCDPTRREVRFPGWDKRKRACFTDRLAHRAQVKKYCDVSTKPSTFVLRKKTKADDEYHEEWAKKRDVFRAAVDKFDRPLLEWLLGGVEPYETLRDTTFLYHVPPPRAVVTAQPAQDPGAAAPSAVAWNPSTAAMTATTPAVSATTTLASDNASDDNSPPARPAKRKRRATTAASTGGGGGGGGRARKPKFNTGTYAGLCAALAAEIDPANMTQEQSDRRDMVEVMTLLGRGNVRGDPFVDIVDDYGVGPGRGVKLVPSWRRALARHRAGERLITPEMDPTFTRWERKGRGRLGSVG